MNNSNKILKRLESLHPKQIDLSLNRLLKLLNKLGNPHSKLPPTIHVAGTNGKGSTIAFLRSIFEENNYKVHVYTSPHLINFNERIRLNSKIISNEFLDEILKECEFYNKGNPITFFEITTAAAFLAFNRINADILLLETGLGGRFDATNVITKTLCNIITPISMDHMSFLGNTIESIAMEKIGILKNNTPAIIAPQNEKVINLINTETQKKKIKTYFYKKEWEVFKKSSSFFFHKLNRKIIKVLAPKLFGDHQFYNAGAAITAAKIQDKFKLNDELISKGIEKTFWPARMQELKSGKLKDLVNNNFEIWLDGGHNLEASQMIYKNLKKWKTEKKFLIFGMIQGKKPNEFLKKIIKEIEFVQIIPIKGFSSINSKDIINTFNKFNHKFRSSVSVEESIKFLNKNYAKGKIIICGSLYLAGEILKKNNSKIT